ncbi:hypothetical protein B0J14DRAFT_673590 [Halenospora varia]|nr:hypothetical protein B0J14DRAFT_673590 [Halenospora varia]
MTVAVAEAGSFYEISNANYRDLNDWQPLIDWGLVTEPQVVSWLSRKVRKFGSNSSYQAWADEIGDQSYTFNNMFPYFKKTFTFGPPNPLNLPANVTNMNYSISAYDVPGGDVHVSFPNYVQPVSSYAAQAFSGVGFPPAEDFTSGNHLGYGYHPFTIDPTTGTNSSSDQLLQSAIRDTSLKSHAMSKVQNIVFSDNSTAIALNVTTNGPNLLR